MALIDTNNPLSPTSVNIKGYRLMVKADDIETTTESGIVLVIDEKRERAAQNIGTVVKIGDLCWTHFPGEPWCKVGDKVLYSRYAGRFIMDPITEEEYCLLNDEDIIAVIEEVPNGRDE